MAILGHLMTKSTCAQRRSREKILHLEMPVNMTTEGNGVPGPCPRKPPEGALFLSALSVPAGARALILADGPFSGGLGHWGSAWSTGANAQTVGLHHLVISPGALARP